MGADRCGYARETLPHVVNHCRYHSDAWQRRHNAVLQRLVNSVRPRTGVVVSVNRAVAGVRDNLRPDLVIRNEAEKRISIVDVTIPFEGAAGALEAARQQKLDKYGPLAAELQAQGYEVYLEAFVVDSLEAWLSTNDAVIRQLRVAQRYGAVMARLMVSDVIRWTRDIYIEHLSGIRQYQ